MSTPQRTHGTSAPTAAQKRLAHQRAAAARARIDAARRRRRIWTVTGALASVVVLVLALVVVKVATGSAPKSGARSVKAADPVAAAIAAVPAASFDAVGAGSGVKLPHPLHDPALTADGKPRVLYIGGEFCPFCAAERWPLAVALARFGTFHNLGQTSSGANDVFPGTATLSFHGATYDSRYLAFSGIEAQSNTIVDGSYTLLDPVGPADTALWKRIAHDSYPLLDIGGRWVSVEAPFSPQVLRGSDHRQIAAAVSDPNSPIGRDVLAAANGVSAAICTVTHNLPASVCTSSGVRAAAAGLRHGG